MRAGQSSARVKVEFLCIGGQRCGTSWLSTNLKSRPDFWIPPIKELHYFTRSAKYESPSFLSERGPFQKFFGLSSEARSYRRSVLSRVRKQLLRAPLPTKKARLAWLLRYYLGRPSDEWYCGLFREGAGKIKGELTPAYSLLDDEDVAGIARLFPELKIVLLMRDPVERVLSQLRYHLDGRAEPALSNLDEASLVAFASARGQVLRGNYPRTLDIWQRHFPTFSILTTFYEDICRRPVEALARILHFLGADSKVAPDITKAHLRVNAASEHIFSADIKRMIARAHEPIVEDCARRFGGHAVDWLGRCKVLTNSSA